MDNTKTFTKIILAAIGIFFIIKIIPQIIQSIAIVIQAHSWDSLWPVSIGLLVTSMAILLLWYFFFYLRDWLAEKIISVPTGYEFSKQIPWFPLALRLGCIFAGLYCLSFLLLGIFQIVHLIGMYIGKEAKGITTYFLSSAVSLPIILIAGIYLVCGAPHFVRWQVRKTLEQCKKLEQTESA